MGGRRRAFHRRDPVDRSGNLHRNAQHLAERITRTGPDHLLYAVEAPKVFTRLWKMSMPLYRVERNVRILEYECPVMLEAQKDATCP